MSRLVLEQMGLLTANFPVGDHGPAVKVFGHTLVSAGAALRPGVMFKFPAYRAAKSTFEHFLFERLELRKTQPDVAGRRPDMIDRLLRASGPEGQPLGERELFAAAHMPYVNGYMYITRAVGFMLYELLSHPPVLARVIDEIDSALAHGIPDAMTLKRMVLTRGSILETLRLHPSAVMTPRYIKRDFEFGGYHIPAGRWAFIATTVAHFLPEFYPEPFEFDPTRCSEPRNEYQKPGAYAPFGVGPHACMSIGLVETVMATTIAGILRRMRLGLIPGRRLRSVVKPVPGPDPHFTLRVLGRREPPAEANPLPHLDEELSMILPGLSEQQLQLVESKLERPSYEPGQTIIQQGANADRFFILTKGEVEVVREREHQPEVQLAHLHSGSFFGEIGLLHHVNRTATVRAVTKVETLALDRDSFSTVVAEADLTSAELARVVQRRLMSSTLADALPKLLNEEVASALDQFELRTFGPGETVIREGDAPDKFYIVAEGQAEVTKGHHVAWLREGQYFGEIGLLNGCARTATVKAAPDQTLRVMALDRAHFLALMQESTAAGRDVTLTMYQRLLELSRG